MFATAGATRSTAPTTVREYSSSSESSLAISFLPVNPEPFRDSGLFNRRTAAGVSSSNRAKLLILGLQKIALRLLGVNYSNMRLYNRFRLLLSSCARELGVLKGGMRKSSPDGSVMDAQCPSRLVLDRIADKWTALIIQVLANGTKRYAELQREIGGISQKMLTQTLRSLERDGLVQRKVHPVVPPKVEYSLTKLGRTLIEPLHGLCRWSEKHLAELQANRARAKQAKPEY